MNDKTNLLINLIGKKEEITLDELILLTSISQGELSTLLLQLELENKILSLPGKRYTLKN